MANSIAIHAFNMPMQEAIDFWASKMLLTPGQYAQLSDEAKVKAFAVSGIAQEDELCGVYQAIQKAIEDGSTLEQFKADCAEIFSKRGWTENEAGARRIDTIFRNNLQTAYSVGRYSQATETADTRPYAQYIAVEDENTRPEHWAHHLKVYPLDHPFWNTWWPLNGHKCRCTVITLSARQVREQGLSVETEDPTNHLYEPVDPETGVTLPARPLLPDKGFAYHPGKVAWGMPVKDIPSYKDMPALKTASDYRRPSLNNVRAADMALLDKSRLLPAGQSNEFYRQEFLKRYGQSSIVKDPLGKPVILSPRIFELIKGSELFKFTKSGHGPIIPLLDEMIKNPYEVWITTARDEGSGQVRLVRRYISLWKTEEKQRIPGLGVFEVTQGQLQGVSAFAPEYRGKPDMRYAEEQRRGILIYKK